MPTYKVLAPTWLGQRMAQPGELIELDSLPGATLEPVDADGRAQVALLHAQRAEASAVSKVREAEASIAKHREALAEAERAQVEAKKAKQAAEAAVEAARKAAPVKTDAKSKAKTEPLV